MANKPIMPTATAVWLVENTTLTFRQIAVFCGFHQLEVQGIADDEVAVGTQGLDPVINLQLEPEEIQRGEADPDYDLVLMENPAAEGEERRRGKRYTPLSKRQDRPAAIAWLVKNHPEMSASQISKLIGTTKSTIDKVRDRTHWNISNIQPTDPVALGLCGQIELDEAVRIAGERAAKHKQSELMEMSMRLTATDDTKKDDQKNQSPLFNLGDFSLGSGLTESQ